MRYTINEICLLMGVSGVPVGVRGRNLVKDSSDCVYYFYHDRQYNTKSHIMDTLDYIKAYGGAGNRRVCYVMPKVVGSNCAVLLQLSGVEKNVVCELFNIMRSAVARDREIVLDGKILLDLSRRLYKETRVLIIGGDINGILRAVKANLCAANANLSITTAKLYDDIHSHKYFVEWMVQFLKHGRIGKNDPLEEIGCRHDCYFRDALTKKFMRMESEDPESHKRIFSLLCILLKYRRLIGVRRGYPQDYRDIESVDMLIRYDAQRKKSVYRTPDMSIIEDVEQISVSSIRSMLAMRSAAKISKNLERENADLLENIRNWESNLDGTMTRLCRDRMVFSIWKGKLAARSLYQSTMIPVGGMFVQWTFDRFMCIADSTGLLIIVCRHVPTTLNRDHFRFVPRWLGYLCGALLTVSTGIYGNFRIFTVGNAGIGIAEKVNPTVIDDKKAIVIEHRTRLGTAEMIALCSLTFGFVEFLFHGNPFYLYIAVGSVLGSLAMKTLAKRQFLDKHDKQDDTYSEDQTILLLLCAFAGNYLGYLFSTFSYMLFDKLSTRSSFERVVNSIAEERNITAKTNFAADSIWSPSFWTSWGDRVRMSNTRGKSFCEMECEIRHSRYPEKIVECDELVCREELPISPVAF